MNTRHRLVDEVVVEKVVDEVVGTEKVVDEVVAVVTVEALETLVPLFKIVWRASQACSFSSVPLRVWF